MSRFVFSHHNPNTMSPNPSYIPISDEDELKEVMSGLYIPPEAKDRFFPGNTFPEKDQEGADKLVADRCMRIIKAGAPTLSEDDDYFDDDIRMLLINRLIHRHVMHDPLDLFYAATHFQSEINGAI